MGVAKARFFVGQGLLAFLPALIVMLVSRDDGRLAADLSVALAVIGATFSIAYCGQRAYVSIRGFDAIPCRQAIAFRAACSLAAAGVALAVSRAMGLALGIAAFAVALKLSEGVLDLWVGIRIRLTSNERSSRAFLVLAFARAALIAVPLVALGGLRAAEHPLAVPYLAGLAALAYAFVHVDTGRIGGGGDYRLAPRRIAACAWEMRAFAAATAVCAVLSASPRLVLPYAGGADYEAAALALSIVPIFGLAFQALWLGNVKRLSQAPRRHARLFAAELAALTAVAALLGPLWRRVGALLYGMEAVEEQRAFAAMLFAGVLFSASIGLSNLFKLTPRPRHEALNYALGTLTLVVAVAAGLAAQDALLCAAGAMALRVAWLFERGLGRRANVSARAAAS